MESPSKKHDKHFVLRPGLKIVARTYIFSYAKLFLFLFFCVMFKLFAVSVTNGKKLENDTKKGRGKV